MTSDAGLWLTPLLLLPGVALLIMSTSARYSRLHDEVHHLLGHAAGHAHPDDELARLLLRARRLRDALVCLYAGVGLFSLASLLGLVTLLWDDVSNWVVLSLVPLGIGAVTWAAYQLTREAVLSLEVITLHGEEAMRTPHAHE